MMSDSIRVLVIDDSALMRQMISRILKEAGFDVVGVARDGIEGLEAVRRLNPDVVTLDVEMPRMDGLSMLRQLMKVHPVPVVMLSSLTQAQAPATVEALSLGAVDFVPKPGGGISLNIDEVADQLVHKVRTAAKARVTPLAGARSEPVRPARTAARVAKEPGGVAAPGASASAPPAESKSRPELPRRLVVVGSSTGGPRALVELVTRLPGDFSAPMVIVQHMPAGFTASLAARLDSLSQLAVAEAKEGVVPQPGEIWVAPGGFHLLFDRQGRMRLDNSQPPHLGVRPAVDLTMESAVEVWRDGLIGVILTGMGMDGAKGARRIKQHGGLVVAQDEATSVVYGMPRAVVEMGLADHVAPIETIAGILAAVVRRAAS